MDVRVKCFNVPGADPALMVGLRQAFIDEGFSSVADELSGVLRKHLGKYGLPVELAGYDPERSDTFADPAGRVLCRVSLDTGAVWHPSAQTLVVSAVCDGEEGEEQATGILGRCVEQSVAKPGLPEETREVERVRESLQTLSPNGRLLSDPAMSAVIRELHDLKARQLLGRVVEGLSTARFTVDILSYVVDKADAERPTKKWLADVLAKEALFSKEYVIACPACGEMALTFPNRQRAQRALRSSSSRACSRCGEGLGVTEAYAVTPAGAKALQQGLWLESVVYDALRTESLFACAGRMLEAFELDVACVLYGNVVLVECKDAPFGQNDYMNLVVKAQELRANVVGIVTTKPLHENVKRLVTSQSQRRAGEWLVADDMDDAAQIAKTVAGWVHRLKEGYLHRLFSRERQLTPSSMAWDLFRRQSSTLFP